MVRGSAWIIIVLAFAAAGCAPGLDSSEARYETTVRARADFENGDSKRAVRLLSRLAKDTRDPVAWTNLGLVQRGRGKHEAAERAWSRALDAEHAYAAAWYWLGVSRHERSRELLRRAAEGGRNADKTREAGEKLLQEAARALESAAGADPVEPAFPRALAALYRDLGQEPAAVRAEAEAHRLDPAGLATLESSGLAALQLPSRPRGAGAGQIPMRFESQRLAARATGVTAADLDGDGRPELMLQGTQLSLHADSLEGGMRWTPNPILPEGILALSVRADVDGDERDDLLLMSVAAPESVPSIPTPAPVAVKGKKKTATAPVVIATEPTRVWLRRGSGGAPVVLADVPYTISAVRGTDLDRDGDVDLVLATTGSPAVRVWRNVGGRLDFESGTLGLDGLPPVRDLACADFNGDRRPDVACVDRAGRIRMLLQASDGGFVDGSGLAGLTQERARAVAAADMDADGWTDLLLGNDSGLWVYSNRGAARFVRAASYRVPQTRWFTDTPPQAAVSALRLVDLDNDGLQDVLSLHPRDFQPSPAVVAAVETPAPQLAAGKVAIEDAAPELPLPFAARDSDLRIWRNDGRGVLLDATLASDLSGDTLQSVVPAAADFDGDGDLDLACVGADSVVVVKWNGGGSANRRVLVELAGPRGWRDGIGARIEIHADGLAQSREVLEQPVWAGIRNEKRLGTLRVVWPDGVTQNETGVEIPEDGRLRVTKVTRP